MRYISVAPQGNLSHGYKPVPVRSMEELLDYATKYNWAPGVFKEGHRKTENFEYADFIGLDIDDGLGIDEAAEIFKDYTHLIFPTKSHRKEKNGKVADRFRVVLPLEERISDPKDFRATWLALKELCPAMDDATKDAARYFAPGHKETVFSKMGGQKVGVRRYVAPQKEVVSTPKEVKGQLSRHTLEFIAFSAPEGQWHNACYKAAVDICEQGYSHEEALQMLSKYEPLDQHGLDTVKDVYNGERKYGARGVNQIFNFKTLKELKETYTPPEWIVEGLLVKGGSSLICGEPKAGKSTIVRQLAVSVAQGTPFLRRKLLQGSVLYMAIEENKDLVTEQLFRQGAKDGDPILLHSGYIHGAQRYEELERIVAGVKPRLIVVDTLQQFVQGDTNSYQDVNRDIARATDIARRFDSHVIFIHHLNKPMTSKSGIRLNDGLAAIMGSQGIAASVDSVILFKRNGQKRVFDTSYSRSGVKFDNATLDFNSDNETYYLK